MTTDSRKADLSALRIERPAGPEPSRKKPRAMLKILIGITLVIAITAAYLGLRGIFESVVEVQLVTASYTSPALVNAVLTASGYVVAERKAAVASKGTGRLVYLAVREGDQVRKGEIIARIEDEDVRAALEQARANLHLYEAEENDARQSLDRQRKLLEQGLTSQAEFDAAEARYKRVIAGIKAARAAVTAAEVALENTRIRAPFDGTVLTKHADVGEVVAPFAAAASSRGAVVTIADMKSLEVEVDVSESNIERIAPGQACEIVLDAYPEQRYLGYVSKIVPTADRAKATVLTKVRFKSYDNRVLPEMSAKVTFLSKPFESGAAKTKSILGVPASAVTIRKGKEIVCVVRENRVVEIPVVVGERIGPLVEIKEGITAGEKVIARIDEEITAGTRVKVK